MYIVLIVLVECKLARVETRVSKRFFKQRN